MDHTTTFPDFRAILKRQRERAERGDPVRVEELVREQPSIADDRDAMLDLIYQEFVLREQAGDTPSLAEYVERFPTLRPELEAQLEVERFLASRSGSPSDTRPNTQTGSPTAVVPEGYEVLGTLGQGGMGVVYKARHIPLNRLVALKMIRFVDGVRPEQLARFRTEAEAIARLQHPHIVQIFDVGEADGQPFLALELVEGIDLADRLRGDPLPARDGAAFVEALARAVHYAHHRGIVHRDLKPGNILLRLREGAEGGDFAASFKITDFGLAKQLHDDKPATEHGAILGTPSYMAPEQAAGRTDLYGPPVDIYAVGAILYEVLTGRPPFKAVNAVATVAQVLNKEPMRPSLLNPSTPRDLETICLKCLEKEPARRYASCQELADDLGRWRRGEPILARAASRTERVLKWAKRHPAESAAIGTALLTLCALVALGVGSVFYRETVTQRDRAEAARAELEQKNQDIESKNETITSQSRTIQRLLYNTDMQAAAVAWSEGRVSAMLERLDRYRPERTDGEDIRGFEWHYLRRLADTSLVSWSMRRRPRNVSIDRAGGLIAATFDHGTIEVRDSWTGERRWRWEWSAEGGPNDTEISCLAFSADGSMLAVAGQVVLMFDLRTGERIHSLRARTGSPTNSLTFGPAGDWLAGTNTDRSKGSSRLTNVWDLRTGELSDELWQRPTPDLVGTRPYDNRTRGIVAAPDGKTLAWLTSRNLVAIWDRTSAKMIHDELIGPPQSLDALAISPDGSTLAASGEGGTVTFWDVAGGRMTDSIRHDVPVTGLAYHPEGRQLLAVGGDRTVHLWDLETRAELYQFHGHPHPLIAADFTEEGRVIVSVDADGEVRVWEARHPQEWYTGFTAAGKQREDRIQQGPVAAWAKDGRSLVHGDILEMVRFRTADTATMLRTHRGSPYSLAGAALVELSPDDSVLAVAMEGQGTLQMWDAATGEDVSRALMMDHAAVAQVAFRPDGEYAALAGGGPVALFHVPDMDVVLAWPGGSPKSRTHSVAASPAGDWFVFGHADGTISWIATDGDLSKLPGFPPGEDGNSRLFDHPDARLPGVTDAEVRRRHPAHDGIVQGLAFSPDGRWLASAGIDADVKIWDVAGGELLRTLRHTSGVLGVDFHPDGTRLATAGADNTARLWDTVTWQQTLTLRRHGDQVLSAEFSPDGQRLMTTCRDRWVRLWDGRPIDGSGDVKAD